MKKNKINTRILTLFLISLVTSVSHSASFEDIAKTGEKLHLAAMSILIHQGNTTFNSQFSFEHKQDSLSRFLRCVPSALYYAEALKIGTGFFRTESLSLPQELLLRTGTLGAVLFCANKRKPFFTSEQTPQGYVLPVSKPPVANPAVKLSITEKTPCSFCHSPLLDNEDRTKLLMQLPLCHCTDASFAHKACFQSTDQKLQCATCAADYYFPQQKTRYELENGQWLINY